MSTNTKIALLGNPNVGKSTVFNLLTGLKQHTGNWPGKTVAVAQGRFTYGGTDYTMIDLPGTYSLVAHSQEEEVALDYILSGDYGAVCVVCDATCLVRCLPLALMAMEITPRVVLCVNLIDEARKRSICIDGAMLERALGVPVACVSARDGAGIDGLMKRLNDVCAHGNDALVPTRYAPAVERAAAEALQDTANARWHALRQVERNDESLEKSIVASLYLRAESACAQAVSHGDDARQSRQLRIDRVLTGRRIGIPAMLGLLALVFYLTIIGSNYPSQLLSGALFSFQRTLGRWLYDIGAPAWAVSAFIDGIYKVAAWVVAVMLPPMAIFFPLFTLLEDLGYLPRVAFNLDGYFRRCKSCGKQALTMLIVFIILPI